MGCGGSRVASEYLEKNKDKKLGTASEFQNALELLEEQNKSKIVSITKVDYLDSFKSIKGLTGQQWIITALYENTVTHTNSVLVGEKGKTEIELCPPSK